MCYCLRHVKHPSHGDIVQECICVNRSVTLREKHDGSINLLVFQFLSIQSH